MSIKFYSTADKYGEFSNFYAAPFRLHGKRWPTSEHYFQAQKFKDEKYREEIRAAKSPMIAARLGRSRRVPIRRDWEAVKDNVMREAVFAKFQTHADLKALLVETAHEHLIEDSPTDSYWGCGADGSGKNRLGRILMEVREMLREAQQETSQREQGKIMLS